MQKVKNILKMDTKRSYLFSCGLLVTTPFLGQQLLTSEAVQ